MGYRHNQTDWHTTRPRVFSIRGWYADADVAKAMADTLQTHLQGREEPFYVAAVNADCLAHNLPDADVADNWCVVVWPYPNHTPADASWATVCGYIDGWCAAQFAHAELHC